jgi:hypothetical protein
MTTQVGVRKPCLIGSRRLKRTIPRQSLRGDFAACGSGLTPGAMRAYLNEAKALSSDYYVGMLVDDLLEAVDAAYATP